jgi:hypothetical protein
MNIERMQISIRILSVSRDSFGKEIKTPVMEPESNGYWQFNIVFHVWFVVFKEVF